MCIRQARVVTAFVLCATILCVGGNVLGSVLTFPMGYVFSADSPPSGNPPWLTVTIDDGGGMGSVTMKLTATDLAGSEFVSKFYLNLDPTLNPSSLVFSAPAKTGDFEAPSISQGRDGYKAGGDGYFDIEFGFATKNADAKRFGHSEAVQYTISGIAGLKAESFDFLSVNSKQGYPTAAHIQGIGDAGSVSAWIAAQPTVPEPATLSMVLAGGLIALLRRRRGA